MVASGRNGRVRIGWLVLALAALAAALLSAGYRSGSCVDYADGTATCSSSAPVALVAGALLVAAYSAYRAFRRDP